MNIKNEIAPKDLEEILKNSRSKMVFENLQPYVVCEIQYLSSKNSQHRTEIRMWSSGNLIYSTDPNNKDSNANLFHKFL